MYLILLLCGMVFSPKVHSLKCNLLNKNFECREEFSRCGIVRQTTVYQGGVSESSELLRITCWKPNDCKEASYNYGILRYIYTSTCCDTDLCSVEEPPQPNITSNRNGRKCRFADKWTDKGTVSCIGDETLCFTMEALGSKGCATRTLCDHSFKHGSKIKCCEGDDCNGEGKNSACSGTSVCLLLLIAMIISLFF